MESIVEGLIETKLRRLKEEFHSEIEQLKSSRVSIMPEGLENQLNPQAMADLLAYLLNTP